MPRPVPGERKETRFPETIGRYDVLLPLASGGMGTVYLARISGAHGFEREVAVKLMHAHLRDAEGFGTDLVEEGKLAVRIRHPNVVSVLDVGEDVLGLYLVMDYVEGDSLWGLLRAAQDRHEQVPIPIGIRILSDALSGLHAAHEVKDAHGHPVELVHRDFSPHNILVGIDGIGRLTDFGVAKAATRIGTTGTGIVKGKMSYMSPEQARGESVDRRTDVWAAGVIAWEIVAGRRLFPSGNDASTLLKIVQSPPPPLSEVVPGIAPAIDAAVMKALQHDVEQRWPTATAFRQALLGACAEVRLTAEMEDVSDYVTRMVGARLEQRRERIMEVVALRERVEAITQVEPTHTPSRSRQVPAVKPPAPEPPEEATVVSSSAPPPEPPAEVPAPEPSFAAPENTEIQGELLARPPRVEPRRGAPVGLLAILGVGAVVISFVVVLAIFLVKRHGAEPAPTAASTAAATAPPVASPTPVASTPAPVPTEAPKTIVRVRSNAPLASLRVGDRTVAQGGARQVELELTADEAKSKQTVEAIAVDKRRTTFTIAPGATSAQATFAFVVSAPITTKSSPPALAPVPYGN